MASKTNGDTKLHPPSQTTITPDPKQTGDADAEATAGVETGMEELILPPDGGWGWVVMIASFFINFIVDGVCYTFGIINVELLATFEGATSAETALVGSLVPAVYLMVGQYTKIQPPIHSSVRPSYHPSIRPTFNSFIHPRSHSSIQPPTHSFIHPLIHPTIQSPFSRIIHPA